MPRAYFFFHQTSNVTICLACSWLCRQVGVKEAVALTDVEFGLLGVSKIGDRVRIRLKCREHVNSTYCAHILL